MSDKISRRDFLKLAGAGAAVTTVLTGCGPASRYVTREPYTKMPEYTYNGLSTYYASSCRECAAGCGIVVRTNQGRAIKIEGNKNHPVNLGRTCARGQVSLQGLYNPDRIQNPSRQSQRGSTHLDVMTWDDAIAQVTAALKGSQPGEIAFLMGLAPDHLFDLTSKIADALGAPAPLRYGALSMFEARATLTSAAETLLGKPLLPFFDLANADVAFSFGANFLETWISPVAYTRGLSKMRQGRPDHRGYLVQFEPRLSQTAAKADEWVPIRPGTEGLVALAIGRLAAEVRGGVLPDALSKVDVAAVAAQADVSEADLKRLAGIFANAAHALAIPGGAALGQTNGLAAAQAVLALNLAAGNIGKEGGVYLSPAALDAEYHRPASVKELGDLAGKMNAGQIKVLFVHGVNPLFELPAALGFAAALKNVPLVISFASFPDETAAESDFVFPDHTPLESWGYQRIWSGADRATISGAQPVVVPFYNTRATADVLLAAVQQLGGSVADALPFKDEVEFIHSVVGDLISADGFYSAGDLPTFMAQFQQYGGWWKSGPGLEAPVPADLPAIDIGPAQFAGDGDFYLFPFPSPILGDGAGANRPWLQEIGDPTTTVTWGTWVEINPKTAEDLGIDNDDVVLITSPAGKLEVPVYKYPAIRPDTIAIPFGQGHTALGRYAAGRGVNPADLLGLAFNASGDLAFGGMKVKIEKTGKTKQLARIEGVLGVYGEFGQQP